MRNGKLTFADLEVGETFEFEHRSMEFHRDLAHGPWVKTSPRRYYHTRFFGHRHVRHLLVGTVKVAVRRDSCGGSDEAIALDAPDLVFDAPHLARDPLRGVGRRGDLDPRAMLANPRLKYALDMTEHYRQAMHLDRKVTVLVDVPNPIAAGAVLAHTTLNGDGCTVHLSDDALTSEWVLTHEVCHCANDYDVLTARGYQKSLSKPDAAKREARAQRCEARLVMQAPSSLPKPAGGGEWMTPQQEKHEDRVLARRRPGHGRGGK